MATVRTVIVGGGYTPNGSARTRALLKAEALVLLREPGNPHDRHAVAVYAQDGTKLGYVPRTESPLVAKAIDENFNPEACAVNKGSTALSITWDDQPCLPPHLR